ncbi:hypothetical protein DU508_13580 [Pedobacter chinensis]|uniref:Uncharacterized protein n=2 Tax=Pedobacter chinensis TaxID=2282421 RepID=A0A369Q0N6_9SPHI|nr:hypothetical protein DU508_13585 [Pedobacter chinensis]RDC56601.1 hypothetical protein DU508_13580 [Pedobacter chinensis]
MTNLVQQAANPCHKSQLKFQYAFHLAKPKQCFFVLLKSGLTNFSAALIKSKPLTLKKNFQPVFFVSF